MAGWVWLDHPDLAGGPERFPDDPGVIRAQEARGWQVVDAPAVPTPPAVAPDEVDDRGRGWVHVRHNETGGHARIPVEVFGAEQEKGWESTTALAAAEAKKRRAKKSTPVGDDNPKEQ